MQFLDPCENTGQCQSIIEDNCKQLFANNAFGRYGSVQQAFGYESLQDCLVDPRQVPLQCQPNNLQKVCQAAAAAPATVSATPTQTLASCLQKPLGNSLGAPLNLAQYSCLVNRNVQTAQDLQACQQSISRYLVNPYIWPQGCQAAASLESLNK